MSKIVQKKLLENELTERHARTLLRLTDEEQQLQALNKIIKEGLTVKKTEELIERMLTQKKSGKETLSVNRIKRYLKDIRLFTNSIKQTVGLMVESGIKADYIIDEQEDGCDIMVHVTYL